VELDTGSGLSIITKADYDATFPQLPLQPTAVVFKTYTGEQLKPIGVLTVNVEYNTNRYVLNLYVVNRGGPPLLEWLKHIELDWHNINCLSSANILAGEVLKKIQDLQAHGTTIFSNRGLGNWQTSRQH